MKRARVEMLYHLRCADCASAHRNLCRAIWRLQRSVRVDVGLLPASIPARPMHEHDLELHCLIQHTQRNRRPHALMQILMDAMAAKNLLMGLSKWTSWTTSSIP